MSEMVHVRHCRTCNKDSVIPTAKEGRFYSHRDVAVLVPNNYFIPRCIFCEEEWLSDAEVAALNDLLAELYDNHREKIDSAIKKGPANSNNAN